MKRIFSLLAAALLLTSAVLLPGCTVLKQDDASDTASATDAATGYASLYPAPTATEFTGYADLNISEYLTLAAYEGTPVTMTVTRVTDQVLEDALKELLASFNTSDGDAHYEHLYADAEGNPLTVKEGDRIIFDYSGSIDGVAFEGGTAKWAEMMVQADNGFIDGFWQPFVGRTVGETFTFELAFPENYVSADADPEHAALFNGKTALWTMTVRYVAGEKTTPAELTDALVQEYYGNETVEEFRNFYRKKLEDYSVDSAKSKAYETLWAAVRDGSTVIKYPEGAVEYYHDYLMNYLASYADYYGTTMSQVMLENDFENEAAVQAYCEEWVKEYLVLHAVIQKEGLDASTGYDAWLKDLAESYGVTPETLESYYAYYYGEDYMTQWYTTSVVYDKLLEKAAVTTEYVDPVPTASE